ncbi:hypothetical protein F4810DRAFT_656498 [Camillea tinctor]|nr:hypothetical protein F4810DRAFT_656498 [Camillea tinctor]
MNMVNERDLDKIVDAVKTWLRLPNNTGWLLVYDGYDNPSYANDPDPLALDIHNVIPSYQGSGIITTKSQEVGFTHQLQVNEMENPLDSVAILSTTSNRQDLFFFVCGPFRTLDKPFIRG